MVSDQRAGHEPGHHHAVGGEDGDDGDLQHGGGAIPRGDAEAARLQIANFKLQIANSIPFRDVHIHPTILDGKGERMSKTKGNGVDPVDVISTHGADALRFTLTQMATETQDAKNARPARLPELRKPIR